MDKKSFKTLEFNKIIDMLSSKAISSMGKEKASNIMPTDKIEEIIELQNETTEAASIILRKGSLPLGGIKDIRPYLKRVAVDGVLNIAELLYVGDFIYVSKKVLAYSKAENKNDTFEILMPLFEMLQSPTYLEKEIERCIVSETEVSDTATDILYDIRRSIKVSNDRIKEQLNSIIHSQSYKNMLQDTVVTLRGGRFCVPIKQEYRNSFPGMVHDQSSTGATVFMEPMSVVTLNNKIKELNLKEKEEIDKILKSLSGQVAENIDLLYSNTEILTNLDFIFAKGELSLLMEGTKPLFNTKGYINIRRGKHPLIDKNKVVATDIYLGKDFTTLLITGPNTGGKTVALKTLGLFTLMGQSGLHIPAFDNSQLAIFDNVFADIGDEQSIEQSLSTFSSHMTNIVSILGQVTDNSLVLLDELGAGTDPTEGAALAIAILKYLFDRQIRAAVTTHYSELKMYALSTKGVENASCEFDVETLSPTYKLLIGIAGKSNAFAISKRLGLEEHIINSAREVISSSDEKFEDIITDLEITKKTVMLEKDKAEAYRRDAEVLKKDFEKQKQKLKDERVKILEKAREEARQTMLEAKNQADALIKEIIKQSKATNINEMNKVRTQINQKMGKLSTGINQKNENKKVPKTLNTGDRVFIHTLNQTGIVMSPPDANKDVMVKAGIMKVKIPINQLSLDESEEVIKVSKSVAGYKGNIKAGKSQNISTELDIRGHMVEEGLEKTDKYLDNAYLAGIKQVTIIHGKGTGVLRSAVQTHLKGHSHVKSYRAGIFGEGENGVTVVELK